MDSQTDLSIYITFSFFSEVTSCLKNWIQLEAKTGWYKFTIGYYKLGGLLKPTTLFTRHHVMQQLLDF